MMRWKVQHRWGTTDVWANSIEEAQAKCAGWNMFDIHLTPLPTHCQACGAPIKTLLQEETCNPCEPQKP